MIYPATYDIVVLQNSSFRMRLTATQSGSPVNISGYTIDGDICNDNHQIISSFVPTIVSAASGVFDMALTPAQTSDFTPGVYNYDISLTSPGDERYYWLKGAVVVSGTCSRE